MWESVTKISSTILSVLSKAEPGAKVDLNTGSDQKVPAPTGSGSATLVVCSYNSYLRLPVLHKGSRPIDANPPGSYRYRYLMCGILFVRVTQFNSLEEEEDRIYSYTMEIDPRNKRTNAKILTYG